MPDQAVTRRDSEWTTVAIVAPSAATLGSLETDTLDGLLSRLERTTDRRVILDLRQVQLLGAAALGTLIQVHLRLQRGGGQLVLWGDPCGVVSLAGLDSLIPVVAATADPLRRGVLLCAESCPSGIQAPMLDARVSTE